jgi:hypothetical protein
MTIREFAKQYVGMGWSVIPVLANAKRPAVTWKSYQTNIPDEATLDHWFAYGTGYGIAVVTGSVSELLVLDCDNNNAVQDAIRRGIPDTPTALTSKGQHFYFRYSGNSIRNSASKIADGMDIRAEGGYVVAPPSIHPTGAPYTWLISPLECELAPPPPWLLQLIAAPKNATLLDTLLDELRCAPVGSRNDTLNKIAFKAAQHIAAGDMPAAALDDIRAAALAIGLTPDEVQATIAGASAAGAIKPVTPHQRSRELINSNLPRIELPGDNRLVSAFALDLGSIISHCGLYRRDNHPVFVDKVNCRLDPLTPESLRTWIEQHCTCFRVRSSSGGSIQFSHTCSFDDARTVIQSVQFLQALPEIVSINQTRLPVMRTDGSIELLPPGYDPASRVFTAPNIECEECIMLDQARAVIDDALSEFPFQDLRSKSVAIAAMLSVFCNNLFPPGLQRPAFIFIANCEGTGKTLLAKLILSPVHGISEVKSCPDNSAELRKELFASAIVRRAYIFLDNLKGHLNSGHLEAFLTASKFNGRLFFTNSEASPDLACHVFITGNALTVSSDMRRRSLFVELFCEYERPEDRPIKHYLDDTGLLALRSQLLSACWAFLRHWDAHGRPRPLQSHNSFRAWADTIAGMVEAAGYPSPLAEPHLANAGDRELDDMRALVDEMHADSPNTAMTFDELTSIAHDRGLFDWIICEPGHHDRSEKSVNASLGRLFVKYDRRVFSGRVRFTVSGKGRYRRYIVKREEDQPGNACDA